jgi:hypothetical protein
LGGRDTAFREDASKIRGQDRLVVGDVVGRSFARPQQLVDALTGVGHPRPSGMCPKVPLNVPAVIRCDMHPTSSWVIQ